MHVCVATGVATGGLCRPAHLNSTEIKVNSFFLRCGKGGGGGGGVVWGFREGRCDVSSGLSQPGGKSCLAVWRSGL